MKTKLSKAADRWLASQKNHRSSLLNAFIRHPGGRPLEIKEEAQPGQAARQYSRLNAML